MASKKKDIRPVITLECTECKERNYATTKNTRNTTTRVELTKFCKNERKHTCTAKQNNQCIFTIGVPEIRRI